MNKLVWIFFFTMLHLCCSSVIASDFKNKYTNGEPPAPSAWHVDTNGPDGDGTAWSTAFAKLQDALSHANLIPGDSISEAAGSYYPDEGVGQTNNAKTSRFHILEGIVLLGDFPINGGDLSSRNYVLNKTNLSGDIDKNAMLTGGHNLKNIDPLFVSTSNLRLTPSSPAINVGANSLIPSEVISDLDGNERIFDMTVNMGAYEYQAPATINYSKYYVDSSSVGGDGDSWATAFVTLQDALTDGSLNEGDTILVAQGTYYPDEGSGQMDNDRMSSFRIPDSIVVLGGFPSGGGSLAARDWAMNKTILSGDIDQNDTLDDGNVYHVVRTTAASKWTYIDGFHITMGMANGDLPLNLGGGWYNDGSYSSTPSNPTIVNIIFSHNYAENGAGGMMNIGEYGESSPSLINCSFYYNAAAGAGGGLVNLSSQGESSPSLINCTFSGNAAPEGGAIYNAGYSAGNGICSPDIINCILWNNGMTPFFNFDATGTITHSLFEHDLPSGMSNGGNNIKNVDPLFVSDSNLRLTPYSPAINMGVNGSIPAGITTDLDGNDRIFDMTVDMGAFEFQDLRPDLSIFYVDSSAAGGIGITWATASVTLQDALRSFRLGTGDTILVAQGTYYPDEGNGFIDNSRNHSFIIRDSVVVLGGFPSGGGDLSARDWKMNKTVLSGDIDQDNLFNGNSYNVIRTINVTEQTYVDGFYITMGNANTSSNLVGGGWYNTSPHGTNGSNPTIANCSFYFNEAEGGAGMFNGGFNTASPQLTNCSFADNSASTFGGGLYNVGFGGGQSLPQITNCTFLTNSAGSKGGGMYNDGFNSVCSPQLTNCSFSGNSAIEGSAIYNAGTNGICSPNIVNCVIWNNGSSPIENDMMTTGTITNSLYQHDLPGGMADNGNNLKNFDPLFADTLTGDLQLMGGSPAIDAGVNDSITVLGITTDLNGNPRIKNGIVDMGAYEAIKCFGTVSLINQPILPKSYLAGNNILCNGLINHGDSTTLKSGMSIDLLPDFKVQIGSEFNVMIEDCVED